MLHLPYGQDSRSFSFSKCLPSRSTVILFSGIITLISERLFLERENFWQTFAIHFLVGFACFCMSAFVMYVSTPIHIKLVGIRNHLCILNTSFSSTDITMRDPSSTKLSASVTTLTKNYTFPPVNNKGDFSPLRGQRRFDRNFCIILIFLFV